MTSDHPKLLSKVPASRAIAFIRNGYRLARKGGRWLIGTANPVVAAEAVPFQGDIDEIIEERPARLIRPAFYIVVALLLLTIVVASVERVEIVVTGIGQLMTNVPPIVLQPMDRAIIRELKVQTGDKVTKGQVLALLDSTFTQADLTALSEQRQALLEKTQGLEAELNAISSRTGKPADDAALPQQGLYRQRMIQYRSRLRVFDEDLLRLQASVRTTEDDKVLLERQLVVAKDVENMRATLSQSQTGSKIQYLDAQTYRMRAEQDYRNAINHLNELQHDIVSKQAERQLFIDEWRRQALDALVAARTELSTVSENLTKASRMNDLVVLTAPENGIVLDVTKLSVGSVLGAAEHLVTIVPDNAVLVAEIAISSKDVGYVKPGDEVSVKVDAFPYQRYGKVPGRLLWVSEAPASTGTQQSKQTNGSAAPARTANASHHGWVELLKTELNNAPEGGRLIPGMTLSADIKIGSRSVVSYVLYPVTRAFTEDGGRP